MKEGKKTLVAILFATTHFPAKPIKFQEVGVTLAAPA